MRLRGCTPPRGYTVVSHVCGSSCCFFCMESSLPSQSDKFLALLQVPAPASPLWWALSLTARNSPLTVFAKLHPTACFCPLSLDLGPFLERHHLLSLSISSSASSSVVLRPGTLAPPVPIKCRCLGSSCTHRSRAPGKGPRCSLCVPKFEKHQFVTHSSSYWLGEWRKGNRKQREGMARRERGMRVGLVAMVAT